MPGNLKTHNLKVFQQLYVKYYIPLCIYAERYTKNKVTAEEVVQETFLKMWEQKDKLDIANSVQAYLFTSVRNQCINYLKHLKVVNKFNSYYEKLLSEAEDLNRISQETGDSIMIANELEDAITEAIDTLPSQCRKIFLMSRSDGLKYDDIATDLGVTLNTVHRQISIALDKLRHALKKYLPIL